MVAPKKVPLGGECKGCSQKYKIKCLILYRAKTIKCMPSALALFF